jgi:membrane protease YdiL (CAAX protease family)
MARTITSTIGSAWLTLELALLYVTLPTLLWLGVLPVRYRLWFLIGVCLLVAGICFFLRVPRGKLGLGRANDTAKALIIGVGFFLLCFVGWVVVVSFLGQAPLPMIRTNPQLLLLIALLYPINVFAQEFVMRAFFFYRYHRLLTPGALIILNSVIFAFVHIIYGHWVSVILSYPLGLFLAWLYDRHPSLVAVTVTHYLFGLLVFASGYGAYFYRG